jgi:dipeptidyl-peptidase-4
VLVLRAQTLSTIDADLARIFQQKLFATESFGPVSWLDSGRYTAIEASAAIPGAHDIVEYDAASGHRTVLVSASALRPRESAPPLDVEDYAWSADRTGLLVFTNSKRVWRQNTRGDYWVLDRSGSSRAPRRLGGDAPPSSLMFAKWSPDGRRVAYVRERDLYVEEVRTGQITRLTSAPNDQIVNGTSDWVYEEELGVRDAFRWSPSGDRIAYWQFDTSGIEPFTLINDTDSLYPTLTRIPYPKAGTVNSAVRVGVVSVTGGETRWMQVPGDPRNTYIARVQWIPDGRALAIQQLNRLQNRNDLLVADASTGSVRLVHRDESRTWVDVPDDLEWIDRGRALLRMSEKDGWRHLYRIAVDDGSESLVTKFDGDVIDLVRADGDRGWAYFVASPTSATEQFLFRAPLSGAGQVERVTPTEVRGFHSYDIGPDSRWAVHTSSKFDVPPTIDLVSLPDHRVARTLVDNAGVKSRFEELSSPPTEFFAVDIGNGVTLDGWMMKPRGFDPSRRYPLLVYVYGEPASQTVVDRWAGSRGLFHRALANQGFVVVSMDNRGTPAPKGAAWRKVIYGTVGDLSSREQATAVRALAARNPFIDVDRVAIWGWSGGGSNTLNAMFRFPDVFKVGVSVAPVPDQRLYDTIYQERYMGLPQDNADGYRLGSPINFAEGLRGKLLVIHGSGDDNVHFQGTERLVDRLVQLGKPFDLMVYPNRSHAISEGDGTSLHVHSKIAHYLLDHMGLAGEHQ